MYLNPTPQDRLYDPSFEKSNCGVGVLMDLTGRRSHKLVEDGFTVLENLDNRGARGAEEKTGDGAGTLIQKPHEFFAAEVPGLPDADEYAVGQLFLPREEPARSTVRALVERAISDEGFELIAWREVPTDNTDLGLTARRCEPSVEQVFVRSRDPLPPRALDSRLYILRRVIESRVTETSSEGCEMFYVCSLDRRKIVYKGLLTNAQLRLYYPELSDERVKTSLVLVHSRFSTNTLGAWKLAHPYRGIVHNGEINTLRGNVNWMRARESELASEIFGAEIEKLKPVTWENQSDTAILDNVLELLVEAGRPVAHALRMLIPEAWEKNELMDYARKDWYAYHSTIVEPWDGPALVAFTDGESVGAILDRNGLRPCRYYITDDDMLIMASEAGVLDTDPRHVVEKGRLRPGQMFFASPELGRIVPDEELFEQLTDERYGRWLRENRVRLSDLMESSSHRLREDPPEELWRSQRAFGHTLEDLERILIPLMEEGKDPIGAMGNATPVSVLSDRSKPLFTYFHQLFAQVSNPPIDYIREDIVTSLESHIGHQRNLLGESPEHCRQLHLATPILREDELHAIATIDQNGIRSAVIDITFEPSTSAAHTLDRIRSEAVAAIREGYEILILSDRSVGPDRIPLDSLLATGAVHHHLVREGLRTRVGLVIDSGQPCSVHHLCTLIGYGADAVCPWLAYDCMRALIADERVAGPLERVVGSFREGVENGIRQVMAKMGISTIESYKGAQIFEAVGLDHALVEECFTGTVNRTNGIGLAEIEEDLRGRHEKAYEPLLPGNLPLEEGGDFYWRRNGEAHSWNPYTVGLLQKAARLNSWETYLKFAAQVNETDERLLTLRRLLEFDYAGADAIPLDEVEPAETIYKRFFTGSMSFGSISKEAHEALAIAMNSLGGTACTGEGGEAVDRFGTERECKNKQVASGRFGVTAHYLANARDIEIKMAQGSKPGEGGHLPGEKVNDVIARVRHTTPGVTLISPPPHHDIYSIEDLAQLIHDLKCANTQADINVKLVSEAGVGIIAAGVAKARADKVLISGHDGGTGASPKTSIKHAGLPWELGLAETQQVLMANNLRSRIRVRVDGGLKTGRDVAVAALLGAEEYGLGTGPLVTLGCIMLRKCMCNTCSVGIATQDPELRAKFQGDPDFVVNYIRFIVRELREIMAALGFRTMDEMIGRVDRLVQRRSDSPRIAKVDLSALLFRPESSDTPRKVREQNHKLDEKLDLTLIELAGEALSTGRPMEAELPIVNRNRTVGTMLSAEVARRYGERGLPSDTIRFRFHGSAGQSFGAFLSPGITLELVGDANDYIGKGLSGGKIIVRTPPEAPFEAHENIIVGNIALYGGTSGEAYFNGHAGERFAVRNSGVMTVVEGVGDHGCEYMTGGVAVILGETGRNFAAGMSGGEAYVLDPDREFAARVNLDMVDIQPLADERDRALVRRLVENHQVYTGSDRARRLLEDWDRQVGHFLKVMPRAYATVLREQMAQGRDIRTAPPPLRCAHTTDTSDQMGMSACARDIRTAIERSPVCRSATAILARGYATPRKCGCRSGASSSFAARDNAAWTAACRCAWQVARWATSSRTGTTSSLVGTGGEPSIGSTPPTTSRSSPATPARLRARARAPSRSRISPWRSRASSGRSSTRLGTKDGSSRSLPGSAPGARWRWWEAGPPGWPLHSNSTGRAIE